MKTASFQNPGGLGGHTKVRSFLARRHQGLGHPNIRNLVKTRGYVCRSKKSVGVFRRMWGGGFKDFLFSSLFGEDSQLYPFLDVHGTGT